MKDLTGMKFGRLTVLDRADNKGGRVCWRCKCDCGNEIVTKGKYLLNGDAKSCGCLGGKKFASQINFNHGMTGTKIYHTWQGIKKRCFKQNCKSYKDYGARGITICTEWKDDFQAFYDYVSQLPHFGEDGYSLDRIDNNGNYAPDNVRFADRKTQARNTRKNIFVEYQGEVMALSEAAEKSGITYKTLYKKYKKGLRGDELFKS